MAYVLNSHPSGEGVQGSFSGVEDENVNSPDWWVAQRAFNGFFLLVCCMCHVEQTHSAHVFPEVVNTRKPQPHKTSLAVHQDVWLRDDRTVTGQPLAICLACSQLLSRTNTLYARPHSASAHEHTDTAHDRNCTAGYQMCRRHNAVKITNHTFNRLCIVICVFLEDF